MTATFDQIIASGRPQMTHLCHSFPALRGASGTDPWDQYKFAAWATRGKSNAERQAAAFVLAVWNGGTPSEHEPWWNEGEFRVGRFDAVHAMSVWDYQQRAAFLAWCNDPRRKSTMGRAYEIDAEIERDLGNRFTYHAPHGNQAERYEQIRAAGYMMARSIAVRVPPSRERSLALTKIEEAVMWANAAIARHERHEPDSEPSREETKS